MVNGDCVVGATNRANIENIQKEQLVQNQTINEVKKELNSFKYLLIATLVAAVANLIL